MSSVTAILTILTDPTIRDEVERVGAAAGVRLVHLGDPAALSRRSWSAATAVVFDESAAVGCARGGLPRRSRVIVLTSTEPTGATWQAAITVGAQRVLALPAEADELVREFAEAGEAARGGEPVGSVIAVIGGRGGAGASLFAAALAGAAHPGLLVDLDPWGGGIDLLLGTENSPGLRWPDLAIQGGRLAWSAVREALPQSRGISILSGTRDGYEPEIRAVDAILDAGRRGGATVICDLPRGVTDTTHVALDVADLVVLVSPCDIRACAAAAAITPRLRAVNRHVGLVVRGPSPGGLRAAEIGQITGLPLLAAMRAEPGLIVGLESGGLRLRRRSALATAARRVLGLLPARAAGIGTEVAVA